jgi:arachidonate 5-lipoxygenase
MKTLWRKLQLWVWTYVFAVGLTLMRSVAQRIRMSHDNGVVGSGTLTIVETPAFPPHDFFQPGRVFPCRLRHASVSYPDDAAIQVRSASLKFNNDRWRSPFDLEMNTGTVSVFWSARSFFKFAKPKDRKGWVSFTQYYKDYPQGLRAAQNGARDVPPSFALLWYHSQTPTLFIGKDGVTRYVKYRLLPEDSSQPEPGIPSAERLANIGDVRPRAGEILDRNYLKDEYARRVTAGPVSYRLQLQLHTASREDSPEIFNSNTEWDEASHPWLELARVEITTVHSWEEAVLTMTSVGHAPPSLAVIPARDMDDFNSLNYMRARMGLVKRARFFMSKTFGIPPRPSSRRIVGDNPWY